MQIPANPRWLAVASCLLLFGTLPARAQNPTVEIPLERCDRLPIVIIKVGETNKRFLVDTAATSMLNAKSFPTGHSKDVRIASWKGTTSASAREVSLAELSLGNRRLVSVKLPAIDLSAIAKACGGPIDGIFGVDLLEQMNVTIDLKRSVARLGVPPMNSNELSLIAEMDRSMQDCSDAFNEANAEKLGQCFDPDFVMSTPEGEYRGREQVTEHFRSRFFCLDPRVHLSMTMNDQQAVGDVVWTSYDYSLESPVLRITGRGMMLCKRSEDRWYILSMHETASETRTSSAR
jgi:ketosteroid isomerase-like protein